MTKVAREAKKKNGKRTHGLGKRMPVPTTKLQIKL